MKTYTKEQILKAAELGEVSMIDANHIVSLLDDVAPETYVTDEDIEKHYPTKSGESVIMQSYMSYNDTLKANYFRREGAKAMRDGLIKSSPVEGEIKSKVYFCSICHENIVDAENGYDTCDECLRKFNM